MVTVYANKQYTNSEFTDILKKNCLEMWRPTDTWNQTAKITFVSALKEVDYAKFREGFHIINHIPTRLDATNPKSFLKLIENAKISMKCGLTEPIDLEEQAFIEGYILGNIGEMWRFLNWENNGTWRICSVKPHQRYK